MTRTLQDVLDDLVLTINDANESGNNEHIGGLLWAAGDVIDKIRRDEWWNNGGRTPEQAGMTLAPTGVS